MSSSRRKEVCFQHLSTSSELTLWAFSLSRVSSYISSLHSPRNAMSTRTRAGTVHAKDGLDEGTRDMFAKHSKRMQKMEDSNQELRESLKETQENMKKMSAELRSAGRRSTDDEETTARPASRDYVSCESAESKYHYLDPVVRDQALAGSLPPGSLPLLIDKNSSFATPGVQDGSLSDANFRFVVDSNDGTLRAEAIVRGNIVDNFMKAIPNPITFIYAWGILMDLMIRGSPKDAFHLSEGLSWYGKWIMDKSATHTWESICRYHIRFTRDRFVAPYSVRKWYQVVSPDYLSDLIQLPRASQQTTHHQSLPNRRLIGPPDVDQDEEEICRNYNGQRCTKSGCRRIHICSACWPESRVAHPRYGGLCPNEDSDEYAEE